MFRISERHHTAVECSSMKLSERWPIVFGVADYNYSIVMNYNA